MILYQDCSSHLDSSKIWPSGGGAYFPYISYRKLSKSSFHWTDFNITRQECFFCNLLQRLFKPPWFVKNHGRQGWGFFSPYIYIENFKNLYVKKHWTDFYITRQKCFLGDPLPRLFKPSWFVKKWPLGAGLISLYIYIENFKNILVRNHWTDFINTWQKSFLVDPLPRLFKLSWFVKKHGRQGWRGLFSLHIYIENFQNLLVRNQWTNFNTTWQECSFRDPLPRLFKPT